MKAFILILVSFLIATIIGQTCNIANTKDNGATDYESCQEYTTSSTSKLCCYVKGKDKNENSISACQELTGTEKGALKGQDQRPVLPGEQAVRCGAQGFHSGDVLSSQDNGSRRMGGQARHPAFRRGGL